MMLEYTGSWMSVDAICREFPEMTVRENGLWFDPAKLYVPNGWFVCREYGEVRIKSPYIIGVEKQRDLHV
jgi:hypothetical protein